MPIISTSKRIPASASGIWDVLGDFPNIAEWNRGVKKSYSTNDQAGGVGATRHCDLLPTGMVEETIRGWEPNEQLVVSIDSSKKSPIKSGLATFDLTPEDGQNSAMVALKFEVEPKWGPLGRLMGSMIEKQLTKAADGIFRDLESAAASTR